jgi:alanyl-tRNA synthetase
MTSTEIRQSFLDFFREKQHTIVPSSSLLPDAPNLLFTNAGMNQFVPIFLGQQKPPSPPRVADTQKCIRAGGKHNDLEDVGLDTYHHTFFEMLGNWSFGDYFKKEAIEWAWELLVERWKFPPQRLYATVYQPGLGEPSEFDQEAYDHWARLFREADLDPKVHVLSSGKADNFWMMGDTGPCGPCSEVHVDLTPDGDTRGTLVNKNDPRCIEIWNLVFIQFNANPDGSFTPLPQRHVDTGMGFERVTAIIQGTKNLTDFSKTISNYETDIFRPIFDEIEKLSGKKYGSTLPIVGQAHRLPDTKGGSRSGRPTNDSEQEKIDVAFRVIADHIRALSFAIADGIIPSNDGRGYVLRRVLRRAVRYGRTLGFHKPFFFKLVDVVAKTMGDVFPEIRTRESNIKETIRREEESFNRTLDEGILAFETQVGWLPTAKVVHAKIQLWLQNLQSGWPSGTASAESLESLLRLISNDIAPLAGAIGRVRLMPLDIKRSIERLVDLSEEDQRQVILQHRGAVNLAPLRLSLEEFDRFIAERLAAKHEISGEDAFLLYDTYGFPLDLIELMARERGLTVDVAGFEELMEQQRVRARAAQRKEIIEATGVINSPPTEFVGYGKLDAATVTLGPAGQKWLIVQQTPFYATMGGQIHDTGRVEFDDAMFEIKNVRKVGDDVFVHWSERDFEIPTGSKVRLVVDEPRRHAIERHHTATHLLHWALHEVVSRDASQKGSYVGPDKLTFDFSSAPLTPEQKRDVEKLVNEKITENAPVSWTEIPFADAKQRKDIIQFFGEKYGDNVRVLQIGGAPHSLNGYSMELCGGTHVRSTAEIGPFRIVKEEAIAAGTRRIEAVAGDAARAWAKDEAARQQEKFEALMRKKPDIPVLPAFETKADTAEMLKQIDARAAHLEKVDTDVREWEKKTTKAAEAELRSRAAQIANQLVASHGGKNFCVAEMPNADAKLLQAVADALKPKFDGPIFLAGAKDGNVALLAVIPKQLTEKFQANKLIQQIAPIVGGKGGGRPENAQGAGKEASKIADALVRARELLS